jgi:hypothetical protein
MTREETLEAIKVMQHYADGGEVEQSRDVYTTREWNTNHYPQWDWIAFEYRIKKTTKKIKLEAWLYMGSLKLVTEEVSRTMKHVFDGTDTNVATKKMRVPSEDKWVEVEE